MAAFNIQVVKNNYDKLIKINIAQFQNKKKKSQ